jgi:hypothetical protein
MRQSITVAALLGNISAIELSKHLKKQHHDNVDAIENTWSRDTVDEKMMPSSLV